MKEFSQRLAEDRKFEFGGEIFRWHYPHWEQLAGIFDDDIAALRELDVPEPSEAEPTAEDAEKAIAVAKELPSTKEGIERTIERILIFVDDAGDEADGVKPQGHKRFKDMMKRKADPIPTFLIGELYRWLLEVSSGRPTRPPLASEAGGGSIEATSSDESPSPAETPTS